MLTASLLAWLIWGRYQGYTINKHELWFFISAAAVLIISLLLLVISGFQTGGYQEITKYSRPALSYPFIALLMLAEVKQRWFWLGIAIGSIVAGLSSSIDVIYFGNPRANAFGLLSPIFFGNHAILFSFLSFLGFFWFREQRLFWSSWVSLAGFFIAPIGLILSESRAAVTAIPILSILLLTYLLLCKRYCLGALFALITLGFSGTMLLSDSTDMKQRLTEIPEVVKAYVDGRNATTLVMKQRLAVIPDEVNAYVDEGDSAIAAGVRLYMWETAWYAFLEKPIIGHGPGSFNGLLYKSQLRSDYKAEATRSKHAHNEYLHTMATRGIIGLAALLAVLIVPLIAALNFYRNRVFIYSFALAGTSLSFTFFGMSDMAFMHGSGATLFTFLVSVLMVFGVASLPDEKRIKTKL